MKMKRKSSSAAKTLRAVDTCRTCVTGCDMGAPERGLLLGGRPHLDVDRARLPLFFGNEKVEFIEHAARLRVEIAAQLQHATVVDLGRGRGDGRLDDDNREIDLLVGEAHEAGIQ